MRQGLLGLTLLAGGCNLIQDVKDVVEGVVEPNVAVGSIVVLDPPESKTLDLSILDLHPGVSGTFFLADARDVNDLEEAPIAGASLTATGCDRSAEFTDNDDGSYLLAPGTDLDLCIGPLFEVERTDVDPGLYAPATVPAAPGFTLPEVWTAGTDLVVPLGQTDYESSLVVMLDATNGDVLFSNEPQGIRGYYEFLSGSQDVVDITLAGELFEEGGVYAVIVTGFIRTPNGQLDEANTVLSVVAGGRGRIYAVTVP